MIIKLNFEELNTDIIRTQLTVFDKHNQIKSFVNHYKYRTFCRHTDRVW
jgi:hypothetical protein